MDIRHAEAQAQIGLRSAQPDRLCEAICRRPSEWDPAMMPPVSTEPQTTGLSHGRGESKLLSPVLAVDVFLIDESLNTARQEADTAG